MARRSKTRQTQRPRTAAHVEEATRILVHIRRGLVGRAPGPSDLRRLARRFGATTAEIQAWSATKTGRRVMSTWSIDALDALRANGRTGIYHLEAQILACEHAADAQASRTRAPGEMTRKAASGGSGGRPVRERVNRRGGARDGGKPRQKRKSAKKSQNPVRDGVKQDPRRLVRVDLPRTPGVLKIVGAQSPARPLPAVDEEDVPSRPVGWSVMATWTGGE